MYSYSFDEENYTGEFDSIDEAIEEARDEADGRDFVYVGKAVRPDPLNFIDGQEVIERIAEADEFCTEWGQGWPEANTEQIAELTEAFHAAFKAWMDKHNLHPTFWNVENAQKYNLANMDAAAV